MFPSTLNSARIGSAVSSSVRSRAWRGSHEQLLNLWRGICDLSPDKTNSFPPTNISLDNLIAVLRSSLEPLFSRLSLSLSFSI
jgi:hypothetical protein